MPTNKIMIHSRNALWAVGCLLLLSSCSNSKSEAAGGEEVTGDKKENRSYAVWMADSELKRTPDAQYLDFREKPKWEYTNGLICDAFLQVYEETEDKKYFRYVKAYADSMINEKGEIKTYKQSDYNIDRVNPGKFLIDLYQETGTEKYKLALETLRDQMREHPRTSEGGFWHKKRYPHQMWLDGLYMGAAFLAKYAAEQNEPALFDDVVKQVYLMDKYAYDPETGLYYHGWDESREQKWADPETGLSPNFWGRAVGWYAMAVVDVLDYLPGDHPEREMVLEVAHRLAEGIVKYQEKETGVWYQVLDQPGREGNYRESSASAMFVYFLLKGTERGYIDAKFRDYGLKGYQGILDQFIKEEEDGTISILHGCAVAGLGGDPYRDGSYEYYVNAPQRANDPKAVGPFILASLWHKKINTGANGL